MTVAAKHRWCTRCGHLLVNRPKQARLCQRCYGYLYVRNPVELYVSCSKCLGPYYEVDRYCKGCKKLISSLESPYSRMVLLVRDGFRCQYCRRHLTLRTLVIDHFVPKICGGASEESNLRCCCQECNVKKWILGEDRLGDLFPKYRGVELGK